MSETSKLPIKVVPTLERDFYRPVVSGGPPKIFGEVNKELRQKLSSEVIAVRDQFASAFKTYPGAPAVARAKVKAEAMAKSHRPTNIFDPRTCPIIGAEGLGQILLSATKEGLEQLARRIESTQTKLGIANLSTVDSIEAVLPIVHLPADLKRPVKLKLFRHHLRESDEAIEQYFRSILNEFTDESVQEVRYGRGLKVYRIESKNPKLYKSLEGFVGTQSMGEFPVYFPVRTTATTIRSVAPEDFPPPDPNVDYPVVGVVDSGTPENDPYLSQWRVGRVCAVPPQFQDNSHGSFVSGLIIHPRRLNHSDSRFPSCSAKVLDVVALGKGGTSEEILIATLEDVLKKHPEVKVWNLSLGTSTPVRDRSFSDFGVALDRLQDDFGVTFVLAAGNYREKPLRTWPPDDLGEKDRICPPADSVRSIVVGSVAHREHSSSRVKENQPSPFTRRGPGPVYLPKPELSHIGGNCNAQLNGSQVGVLSLDGKGNVAEDIGTSFATPLASTLFANVSHRVVGSSRLLARALLVHSAALRTGKIDPQLLKYQGFGAPPDVDAILGCDPSQCTLIFELSIAQSVAYEKSVFPMPKCLYINDDTVRANIMMTLVHDTDLDASFGSEYCRSNIEVSLGTYDVGEDGKRHQKKQVPEDPKLVGKGYEKDLVEYGFKWSPVKVYRREMVRGVRGENWRLDLSIHHRSSHVQLKPQTAVLIITVSDPKKTAPVYNEMVVEMARLGWAASDLQVRPRVRT